MDQSIVQNNSELREGTTAILFTKRREGENAETYNKRVAPVNADKLAEEEGIDQLLVMDGSSSGFPEVEKVLSGDDEIFLDQQGRRVRRNYMMDQVPGGKGAALHAAFPFVEYENVVCLDSDYNEGIGDGGEDIRNVFRKLSTPLENGREFVKADLKRTTGYSRGETGGTMKGGRVNRGVKAVCNASDADLSFVTGFEYPLSGEMGMKTRLLESASLPPKYGLEIALLAEMSEADSAEVSIDHSHLSHSGDGAYGIAENVFGALDEEIQNLEGRTLWESLPGKGREKAEAIGNYLGEAWREELDGDADPGIYWPAERFASIVQQSSEAEKYTGERLPEWDSHTQDMKPLAYAKS